MYSRNTWTRREAAREATRGKYGRDQQRSVGVKDDAAVHSPPFVSLLLLIVLSDLTLFFRSLLLLSDDKLTENEDPGFCSLARPG